MPKPFAKPLLDFAVIEDGRIVLYHVDRDVLRGLGVAKIDRLPTNIRSSSYDPSDFPAKTTFDLNGHMLILEHAGRPTSIRIGKDLLRYDLASSEKKNLEDDELSPDEVNNRWRYLRTSLNEAGRLVVVLGRSRLPKGGAEIFKNWAEALQNRLSEDQATDYLYAKHTIEQVNDFLRATFTPRRAYYNSSADTVFALEKATSKNHVPAAYHGVLPDIDWSQLPY